nr:unnamed protein product [Callosobruchus analis]
MCIKFCGTSTSDNPGIYVGLVNFTAEIDALLAVHMKDSQVFKGISKSTPDFDNKESKKARMDFMYKK